MRMIPIAAAALALTAAACSEQEDDVVKAPTPGAAPEAVTGAAATTAVSTAALAFGMTGEQLEDADLLSRQNTDLGDVETLVLDSQNQLTHLVVELEGPGDIKVVVPRNQVSSIETNNVAPGRDAYDLVTDLTAEQLAALPRWTPPAR